MARVELSRIQKTYPGGQAAVRGIDLVIGDGELVALVGPSGSGKSTILRMIAGLEDVTSGEIRIGDRVVNRVAPRDRDIAMVFQEYALYPHMTVFDNMAFGLKMRRQPPAEIDQRVREAAEILEIEELLGRRPAELSGGQRQRVAVGRAIVRKPQVFLLDEPLSNLDAKLRGEMRAELARLHRRLATTMVFVTHDQVEALTLGQRVVVLRDGRVEQVASPLDLYHRPANRFVASFVGSPPMSFLPGAIVRENGGLEFRADPDVRLPIDASHREALEARAGQEVVLGIRPEHLHARNPAQSNPASEAGSASASLEGVVDVIEPLGSELHVSLRVGERPVMARLPNDATAAIDRPCRLEVDMKQARFFDAETGTTLV